MSLPAQWRTSPVSPAAWWWRGATIRPWRRSAWILPRLTLFVIWAVLWRLCGQQRGFVEEPQTAGAATTNLVSPSQLQPQPGHGSAASLPSGLRLAVFDLAGTTLDDSVEGQPLVIIATQGAFARAGVNMSFEAINARRGLDKREAIRSLCEEIFRASENVSVAADVDELTDRVNGYFLEALNQLILSSELHEMPGTSSTFQALRDRGVAIVIGSGFAQETAQAMVKRLGWQVDGVVHARRPFPDAVLEAMRWRGITDPGQVVKVGDTVADVAEGKSAGVWTVAVLSGTQAEASLRQAGPDFILQSVHDFPSLLASNEAAATAELPSEPRPVPQPVADRAQQSTETEDPTGSTSFNKSSTRAEIAGSASQSD